MRIGQALDFTEKAIVNGLTVILVGPPGVGKSDGIASVVTERLKRKFLTECCTLLGPEYAMGYPYRLNGVAAHAPYGNVAAALDATEETVWLWDELGGATETFQKSVLRGFRDREFGGRKLPKCVKLIAATNDVTHGAGVLGMVEPMKDRFHTIVTVEPHIDDTVNFALVNDWPSWLIAFLRNSPDCLCDWKPVRSMARGGSTPRGWSFVSDLDKGGFLDADYASEVAAGAVGKPAAVKALAFRDLIGQLPDVDMCLLNPDTSPVPENPSAKWLVSMAIASKLDGTNFGNGVKYMLRLPQMFRAFAIRDAARAEDSRRRDGKLKKGHQSLQSCRDFAAWVVSEDGKSIMSAAA